MQAKTNPDRPKKCPDKFRQAQTSPDRYGTSQDKPRQAKTNLDKPKQAETRPDIPKEALKKITERNTSGTASYLEYTQRKLGNLIQRHQNFTGYS